MFKYETHLHTSPVSACARSTPEETVEFYKKIGYDGVFITNHFFDGNTKIDRNLPWEEMINQFFSDYERAFEHAEKIGGIKVFPGIEMGARGSHFLVYGLSKQWYIDNPCVLSMQNTDKFSFIAENGGFIVHAHPFREDNFIDHIRLYPRHVHGVEVINASRKEFENNMASHYADSYGLIHFGGSDNHSAQNAPRLAGVECETPVNDVEDFIAKAKEGKLRVFTLENKGEEEKCQD